MLYNIKRKGYTIASVYPTGQQEKEIMTKDIVPMAFTSPDPIQFQIGDYVDVWGERYYLNQLDEPTKDSELSYKYSMTFQASYYALAKPKILFYDATNALKVVKFEVMLNASQLLDLIIANANRTQTGWVRGDCEDTDYQMLTFNGESVLTALDNGAKQWNIEWWVVNKVIHLKKRGTVSGYKFEYGYNKGLRGGLTRTNVDASSVFSRLYVTGSDQNLPSPYRNGQTNLLLPDGMDYIQGPKYGDDEIEAVIAFEDIKPEYIGTITSVGSKFQFSDTGIDFDLNLQLLPNTSAKVSFLTGQLAGFNFEIAKGGYNATSKTVTIITNEAEKALVLPSDLMKPAVGDTFFFFDIFMPQVYIETAENKLLTSGTKYFNEQSVPRVAYTVPPDHFFFRRNNIVLNLGDYVHIKDFDLRINKDIRINSYERDLHDQYKYGSLTISDMPIGSAFIRQIAAAEKLEKALAISQVNNIQRAKSNWKTTNELTTLLDTLRAEMLLIMVDGGAYTTDIVTTTTPTNFSTTAGSVVHEQYKDNDGIWNVSVFSAAIPSAAPYYVYIKASRNSKQADIIMSATKIAVESDPAYYYFPFGIISTVIDGNRIFSSIRGYTRVTGGQIGTGRIVANNGNSYIDLDSGTFNFENALSQLAFSAQGVILGGKIIATSAEFIDLVVKNLNTNPTGKSVTITEGDNNITIYDAARNILMQLDDDAAWIGTRPSTGVKIYGPGISIGAATTAKSALSSTALVLRDSDDNIIDFIGKNPITGFNQVQLDITGGYSLGKDDEIIEPLNGKYYKIIAGVQIDFELLGGHIVGTSLTPLPA